MPKRKKDYHDEFDQFVISFGGYLVRHLVKDQSRDNADYFFKEENVIAELKVIETNREEDEKIQQKIQSKFDEWASSGKLSGIAYGNSIVRSDKLPTDLQWELQRIHSEPIRRLIKKANKQIRLTKETLNLADAKGLMLLLNQEDRSQPPGYLSYAVHQSLINDFSSINATSIFTERLTVSSVQLPPHSRIWIDYTRETTVEPVDPAFLLRLRAEWTNFLSSKLGIKIPRFELTGPADFSSMSYN